MTYAKLNCKEWNCLIICVYQQNVFTNYILDIRGAFNGFPDFFVEAFKMLLLYIL